MSTPAALPCLTEATFRLLRLQGRRALSFWDYQAVGAWEPQQRHPHRSLPADPAMPNSLRDCQIDKDVAAWAGENRRSRCRSWVDSISESNPTVTEPNPCLVDSSNQALGQKILGRCPLCKPVTLSLIDQEQAAGAGILHAEQGTGQRLPQPAFG